MAKDYVNENTNTQTHLTDTQKQRMKDFLKGLTRAEKLVVVLHYYDEMTIGEVAEKLDLSEARVSEMHSSIITRLKPYLQ